MRTSREAHNTGMSKGSPTKKVETSMLILLDILYVPPGI